MAKGPTSLLVSGAIKLSRSKHLKWICLCLFCSWFFLMMTTFITVLYVSYPYTDLQRLSPITLTETSSHSKNRPSNIGVYSNINYQERHQTEESIFDDLTANTDITVIYDLLRRILQQKNEDIFDIDIDFILDKFEFNLGAISTVCDDESQTETIYGCYALDIQSNLISIDGTDILSIISGLNYYITNYWLLSVSWTPHNIAFIYDEYYSFIKDVIRHPQSQTNDNNILSLNGYREYKYTYYKNPCTDSYSMAFWRWNEWEQHIDWMSLNNINLLLLPSLNELIEYILYIKHFKLTHDDLNEYFVGPGFFAWFRMGNLKGWPPKYNTKGNRVLSLSKFWFDEQLKLVKKIMKRCNELGIDIILSAFSGNVPEKMLDLYPNNNFYVGSIWYRFSEEHTQLMFLDCTDPLYIEIGKQYQRIQYNILKSIDYFSTKTTKHKRMYLWLDQFNELIPNKYDFTYLEECGRNHFNSLQLYEYVADPYISIIWVVQGWMFVNERRFWSNERIHSYLLSVKSDDILILDLIGEKKSIAIQSKQFFNHNYIWCFLHNFGGNYYLGGNLGNIFYALSDTLLYHSKIPYLKGIGISMEGITNNEILYNAVLKHSFITEDTIDINAFIETFMASRYGKFIYEFQNKALLNIYSEFIDIVYRSYAKKWGVTVSLIAVKPKLRLIEYNVSDLSLKITKNPKKSDIKKKHSITNRFMDTNKINLNDLEYKFVLKGAASSIDQRWRINEFQSNYIDYNFCKLFENWKKWMLFITDFIENGKEKYIVYAPTFSNDIAEITRQVLSDLFLQMYMIWQNALSTNDAQKNTEIALVEIKMLQIIDDMNDLLSYFKHFRFDEWIKGARSYGEDENEANYMEMNARNLVTRWGPNGEISEYASREWNGLLNNYYKKRWQLMFDGRGFNADKIDEFEVDFQYETIDELDLDQNHRTIEENADFTPFYKTLQDIYVKYTAMVDCKQEELI